MPHDPDMMLTRPLDPADVTKASREALRRAVHEAIVEGARAMCESTMTTAQRVRIAAMIEHSLATLAGL